MGNQEKAKVLGTIQIAQIRNSDGISDYKIVADENPNQVTGTGFMTSTFTIKNHDRKQSVYALIAKATRAITSNFNRQLKRRQFLEQKQGTEPLPK